MKRRRERRLSADELALWRYVTRSITPLPGHHVAPDPAPPKPEPPRVDEKAALQASAIVVSSPAKEKQPPAPPPLAPLERRQLRDLRRGVRKIDARIDLHGMRQIEAHHALNAFLRRSQVRGARLVLVVTGKGDMSSHANPFVDRGVLRRLTPHWLDQPELRPVVLGYSPASREHGGDGALYVRLRRVGNGDGG
ncbi:Smr/MutS family protein [Pseudochelatococcus contaminans]|uniref:DNA-nicking Smr family endonuclease n=1 Tax=Pseudochelatococcus contaminans TaxID=1538103 RepID=A0A7W5Z722_9HYPH|nr:Smr/MutS family protein [Pseudochelatococcus contaminans]MBB3811050.1 DNA-nicking Smr family endonuclease [Pseudochelatococcus contaminans]